METSMQWTQKSPPQPFSGSFLVLQILWSPNDLKQKIEKTVNNTHTTTQ